jgi:pimeloyl-ACP methyl ester carboxylesterase
VEFAAFHRGGSGPPLLLLHGFLGTWRIWELALPALERRFEVLAPALPGHTGGPPLPDPSLAGLLDGVEQLLDDAGFGDVHVAGSSLGGALALGLAARGRARSVVAFAPGGGWTDRAALEQLLARQRLLYGTLQAAAPYADALVASPEGRRRALELVAVHWEHIPAELVAHELVGAARCPAATVLLDRGVQEDWHVDAERIACPVRIAWGAEDALLPWPDAAAGYRAQLPHADWVELAGVGHCIPLDVPLEAAELVVGFAAQ